MSTKSPHYVLYSDALNSEGEGGRRGGRWHFVLEALDGESVIEAGEHEPDPTTRGERLELLSVVRGLEALDQPSRVTLITPSRYVRRGLRFGLEEWRHNRWRWEHFGKLVPIKNQDLWQRVDRALRYHEVKCRWWRLDADHGSLDNAAFCDTQLSKTEADRTASPAGRRMRDGLSESCRRLARRIRKSVLTGQAVQLAPMCGQ